MAAAAGEPCLETTPSDGSSVQSVAWRSGDATVLWLANLTGEAQTVELEGLPAAEGRIAQLDERSFASATSGPDGFVDAGPRSKFDRIELAPYAVARLTVPL
jgi:hypothetical protein